MNPMIGNLSSKSTEDLVSTVNMLHNRMAWASRMGHNNMVQQLKNTAATYQAEYQKRLREEVKAAEENPIFKNSLDIG